MLYATTRSKVETYTAQRALKEERAPDGGLFLPATLPVYDREELAQLLEQPAAEIVARILNEFFNTRLGRLDVEFALGKRLYGMAKISHRIVIGELWRYREGGFSDLCGRLTACVSAEVGVQTPGAWMRIACRIALVFAMFARLRSDGILKAGEKLDVAVLTGQFEGPYALWTARKMGLPVGEIICCCNENSGVWDLINRGQMKLNAKARKTVTPDCDTVIPEALELLIHERLEWDDVEEFLDLRRRGGTYFLSPEEHRHFREGITAAVVSDKRIELAIPNLYRTNGYVLCPYSALVYVGLMDYRSRPAPRRAALMLTEYDPRQNAAAVERALAISDRELREWCLR